MYIQQQHQQHWPAKSNKLKIHMFQEHAHSQNPCTTIQQHWLAKSTRLKIHMSQEQIHAHFQNPCTLNNNSTSQTRKVYQTQIHIFEEQLHCISPHIQTFWLKTRNRIAPKTASKPKTKLNTTISIHSNSKQTIDSKLETSVTQKPQFECNHTHSTWLKTRN